ncbi:Zinc finger BED domain-containing protein [Melia azedarach]|uniref:Zinc finger BED domain-containing protein n=1 Tax=Melia azedarach TaxID=155640 RepID=A0ACC1YIH1_MELAZ|nr:Zinc finger BED domain-containing protein [Melia azedarach]
MSWINIANFRTGESPVFSLDGRLLPFNTGNDDQIRTHAPPDVQEIARTASLEPTRNHDNEIENRNQQSSSRTKRRKLTSKVWKEFTKYEGKDGKVWAMCKYCKKKFDGSSKNGTTHLNNHLKRCRSSRNEDGLGETLAYHDNGDGSHSPHGQEIAEIREQDAHFEPALNLDNSEMENAGNDVDNSLGAERRKLRSKVSQDFTDYEAETGKEWAQLVINQHQMNRRSVTRAIIKHGFSTLNSIKSDVFFVYQEEREKLCRYFLKFSCRFSVAVRWFEEYFLAVLYFIDDSWIMKRKILTLHHAPDGYFTYVLKDLLSDCRIKKNICSVVTTIEDDNKTEAINNWYNEEASLPFGGHLLSIYWLVDLLKSSNSTGTNWAGEKMRKCFSYVRNVSNKQKFQIAVDIANSKGKNVISRNVSSWAFGFEQLEIGVGFKEAFCELEQVDPDFRSINLTTEEWDKATTMYQCQKVLNKAAHSLSESKYTTANVYFPKVCDLYMKLLLWEKSENYFICEVASRARESFFDKFWSNSKLVLAAAVILDPRFKIDIVERWYREIYGSAADGYLKSIMDDVINIYSKYVNASYKMLDEMGRPCTSQPNSELYIYLEEPKVPSIEEFDILGWWNSKATIFPLLAKMARDILAVPISPTAMSDPPLKSSEIENIIFCTGLDDDIKPALICTKSWLESPEDY